MKISFGDIKYLAKAISKKFNFSVDNYGILLISLVALIYMGQWIWGFGGANNPLTADKVEKRGKAYLEQNYPGIYERVQTPNSGTANKNQDGNWSVHYFEREEPNNMFSATTDLSFSLVFDEDLNVITDGYKEYYLKGGSVYSRYRTQFYRDFYDIIREKYGEKELLIKGKYSDKINDYDFENVSFIESGDGYKYTGDYLDPNAEHDTKELYSKYGYLNLRFFMDSGDYSDFKELVKDVADIMQANDMPYNKMRVYMYFKDSDVIFCEGNYTAEEINSDIDTAIEKGTFVHTREERERMKANGEELPMVEVNSFGDFISEVVKE